MGDVSFGIYDAATGVFEHGFKTLLHLLDKAEAAVASGSHSESELIEARLAPDMMAFAGQFQRASDAAKGGVMRLSGKEIPSMADEETTFAQLRDRIERTRQLVEGVSRADMENGENREITINARGSVKHMTGGEYLSIFAVPNFLFHVTTAYAILRNQGLEIGKMDFLVDFAAR